MTSDPWRYRCPNNHASWTHRNNSDCIESQGNYYCESCRNNGHDPHFDELKDMKA